MSAAELEAAPAADFVPDAKADVNPLANLGRATSELSNKAIHATQSGIDQVGHDISEGSKKALDAAVHGGEEIVHAVEDAMGKLLKAFSPNKQAAATQAEDEAPAAEPTPAEWAPSAAAVKRTLYEEEEEELETRKRQKSDDSILRPRVERPFMAFLVLLFVSMQVGECSSSPPDRS